MADYALQDLTVPLGGMVYRYARVQFSVNVRPAYVGTESKRNPMPGLA